MVLLFEQVNFIIGDNMSRTVFNEKNTGHITKQYPMFFGDSLGLLDTVNIVNKEIEDLKEKQRSFRWYPTEINLSQDKQDMLTAPKEIVDLMNRTISWQHLTDSITGRSIGAMFLPHVTNPQAEVMISEWSNIEFVHGESYIHIVKQTNPDPDKAILDTYTNLNILNRSQDLINTFNQLYNMSIDTPLEEKKRILAKVLSVVMTMECVSFMASFAVTFAIGKQGYFQGIVETVSGVARDELLHTRMSYALIKAMKEVDGWQYVFESVKADVQRMVVAIVNKELQWCEYLFSEGRGVLGLSESMLKDTVLFFANTVFTLLELDNPFKVVTENPCKFMEEYIDRSMMQFASQEIQHMSYRQGAVKDDVDEDVDLDFSF